LSQERRWGGRGIDNSTSAGGKVCEGGKEKEEEEEDGKEGGAEGELLWLCMEGAEVSGGR